MADLDHWLSRLGEDADFPPEAADRLQARLGQEPSPRAVAARRGRLAFAAFAAVALASGAIVGGALEGGRAAPATAILPASQAGTATALLFGQAG